MIRSCRGWALVAVALGVSLAWGPRAEAQDAKGGTTGGTTAGTTPAKKPEPASVTAKVGEKTATIKRPEGWLVGVAPRGSIALFRAEAGSPAQIEIKHTPGLDATLKDRYFTAFHASLTRLGLAKGATTKLPAAGALPAAERVEYSLTTGGKAYRLIVTQLFYDKAAWMIIGFFPESSRDKHLQTLDKLIAGMTVK